MNNNTPIKLEFSHEAFRYLASTIRGQVAPAKNSVFQCPQQMVIPAQEREKLIQEGIITSSGEFSAEAKTLIGTLIQSNAFVRLLFEGASVQSGGIIYFSGDQSILMKETQQGISLLTPVPDNVVFELLAHHTGISPYRSTAVDEELSFAEALVFAALIDLRRREFLGALLDRGPETAAVMPQTAILDWIQGGNHGFQWLTARVRVILDGMALPEGRVLLQAIESMRAKGYLEVVGKELVKITQKGDIVAREFLLLPHRILLSAGCLSSDGKNTFTVNLEVAQSGSMAFLLMEKTAPNKVRLVSLSARLLMGIADRLLSRHQELEEFAPKVLTEETSKGTLPPALITCSSCHQQNDAQARFCCHCGKAFAPHCANCGGTLAAGDIFCANCGTRVKKGPPPLEKKQS